MSTRPATGRACCPRSRGRRGHEGEFAAVGTVARVTDRVRLPGGAAAVAIEGLHRGIAGAAETDPQGRLLVEVEERKDGIPTDERTRELETEYRAVVEEILELRGDDGRIQSFVRSITDAGPLADTSGYSPDLSFAQKVQLLEAVDVTERLELALSFQRERLSTMQIRQRIREDVNAGMKSRFPRSRPSLRASTAWRRIPMSRTSMRRQLTDPAP